MKKVSYLTMAIVATMMLSTGVSIAGDKAPGSGPNPYSECGIGAALFGDVHWAAVTSNVTWDLGTTAVTSATMSPETCSAKNVKTAQFIIDTYPKLAEETATGHGEHLATVLSKFGCDSSNHEQITHDLRGRMATEVSSPDYQGQTRTEKATQYFRALDAASGGQCIG